MLSDSEISALCQHLSLPREGVAYLKLTRSSEPSRRVGSYNGNVCTSFSSRKMGFTIKAESHKVEYPAVLEMEYDDSVLEYYDQPPSITLDYQTRLGKRKNFGYTPDFFCIKTNKVAWIECKPEEKLAELAEADPARFLKDTDGLWRCPPGEEAAKKLGFVFEVLSSKQISPTLSRNLEFLQGHLRNKCENPLPKIPEELQYAVKMTPGMTLHEIRTKFPQFREEELYALIAKRGLFVDLRTAFIGEHDSVRVYLDETTSKAFRIIANEATPQSALLADRVVIQIGESFSWSGRNYEILNFNPEKVFVRSEDKSVNIDRSYFETLVQDGAITGVKLSPVPTFKSQAMELSLQASPDDLELANKKYSLICHPELLKLSGRSKRTFNRYNRQFSDAKRVCGIGYVGLLSRHHACGNRLPRFGPEILELVEKTINIHYLTSKSKSSKAAYDQFVLKAKEMGIQNYPSYRYFKKTINRKSKYSCTMARAGKRAAYEHEPRNLLPGENNNNHGDRPLQIAHIDHTPCDIELVCSKSGDCLGRPWISVMIDAYSRRVLAFYLTFDPPSYRSCMMLIRECVRRHKTLPSTLVTDNGKEFRSAYFEQLLAMYERNLKLRPPAKARFGSIIERFFGTLTKDIFNSLEGNTQPTKDVRQMTKSFNPKNNAIWTLEDLHELLIVYFYEIYDRRRHSANDTSPHDRFNAGINGFQETDIIIYDDLFLIHTMPSTPKGTAKVQPREGIKINSIYYWHKAMVYIESQDVPVRFDPENMGVAYAQLKGRWVECLSAQHEILRGRSQKEIKLASELLRKRKSITSHERVNNGKALAELLRSSEDAELRRQRQKDEASKSARRSITLQEKNEESSQVRACLPGEETLSNPTMQQPGSPNEVVELIPEHELPVFPDL